MKDSTGSTTVDQAVVVDRTGHQTRLLEGEIAYALDTPTTLPTLRGVGDGLAGERPLVRLEIVTVQREPLDGDTSVLMSKRDDADAAQAVVDARANATHTSRG